MNPYMSTGQSPGASGRGRGSEPGDEITVILRGTAGSSFVTGVHRGDPYTDGVMVREDLSVVDPSWDMGASLMVELLR